jgi:hypothetical protein
VGQGGVNSGLSPITSLPAPAPVKIPDLVPATTLDVKLIRDFKQTVQRRLVLPPGPWKLLSLPGLALKNSLNKCWFHAGLHLLSTIPALRSLCAAPPRSASRFERRFFAAIHAIIHSRRSGDVASFFPLVSDFGGIRNRYGQKAVPDFFEYLFAHSPSLSHVMRLSLSSILTCSKCRWISERVCADTMLKLHLPPGSTQISLSNLVDYNFNTTLTGADAVFCGNCVSKTQQSQTRSLNPDLCLLEVVRVKEVKGYWSKNGAKLSFPLTDIRLPGFSRPTGL